MRYGAVASCLLAASLLSGCSVGTQGATAPRVQAATKLTPATAARQGRTLPIEAYLLATQQDRALTRAGNLLVARCMARSGFGPPPAALPSTDDNQLYRRYGIVDPQVASTSGYHPEQGSPILVARARESQLGRQHQLTAAETVALYGSTSPPAPGRPPSGCLGEVHRALKGPEVSQNLTDLVNSINWRDYDASRTDPAVRAATVAWASCMASRGYSYPDPLAAGADRRWVSAIGQPSKAEISTAESDVACKQKTRLTEIWFAAESRLQKRDIQRNIEQLSSLRRALDDQIAAVNAVLLAK